MKKALLFLTSLLIICSSFGKTRTKKLNLNKILENPETIAHINPSLDHEQHAPTQEPEEWITIFVHGSVGNSLHLKYFFTLFQESIEGTEYYKETELCRSKPGWSKNHAAQGLGLQEINSHKTITTTAQLFAKLYDQMQKEANPNQTTIKYYTFGWSGLVNHKERCKDAQSFYNDLKKIIAPLKEQNPNLKIRIIAYSHGANMVFNMCKVHNLDKDPLPFNIDELILIAAPVQRETDCDTLDPFFENTYSIYSRADCVQKMDCFSNKRFFSGRKFKDTNRCEIGNVVQQIELKITVAADHDTKCCSCRPSKKRLNRSPGHIEFWHFAELCFCEFDQQYEPCFTSKLYRPFFPFEPLPAAVFAPKIVAAAREHLPYQHAVVELQPDTGKIILRKKYTNEKQTLDFIEPGKLKKMRASAMPYLKKQLTAVQAA